MGAGLPAPRTALSVLLASYLLTAYLDVSLYQLTTAARGVRELLALPQADIDKCTAAYEFFIERQHGLESETEAETEHVRAYYKVLNYLLAVADIEKMYIPPQVDAKRGLCATTRPPAHLAEPTRPPAAAACWAFCLHGVPLRLPLRCLLHSQTECTSTPACYAS